MKVINVDMSINGICPEGLVHVGRQSKPFKTCRIPSDRGPT